MITAVDQRPARFAGWSQRRRWVVAIAFMLAFLCSGLAMVPVVLILDHTVSQGDALRTPTEAVNIYLLELDSDDEIGLRRALAEADRDELLEQWRTVRADMQRTEPPPARLEWPGYETEDQGTDRVRITVQVSATWWGETQYRSAAHPWVFEAHREDRGWRLTKVAPFLWCGGYVYANRCT